ncbi:hypothetical protein B7494_g7201 [Chlorociboria aeruginascens]|nr:hypothetical protein B7494_g7201 [Chlorociboria aeruginascens]
MHFLSYSLVLLSLFLTSIHASADAIPAIARLRRQTTTSCADYSTIANLSTIGLNSTFRAAFLQASPQGTDATAAILNKAEAQLPDVIDDATLNTQCGNLTALALQEAPINFTLGIVGPFKVKSTKNDGGRMADGTSLGTLGLVVMMGVMMDDSLPTPHHHHSPPLIRHKPPSTTKVVAVTKLAISLVKNTTASATSIGRPIGRLLNLRLQGSGLQAHRRSGQITLMRIPCEA